MPYDEAAHKYGGEERLVLWNRRKLKKGMESEDGREILQDLRQFAVTVLRRSRVRVWITRIQTLKCWQGRENKAQLHIGNEEQRRGRRFERTVRRREAQVGIVTKRD